MVLFLILRQVILHISEFWYLFFSMFAIQIITGVALAMHYAPEVNLAFYSVNT